MRAALAGLLIVFGCGSSAAQTRPPHAVILVDDSEPRAAAEDDPTARARLPSRAAKEPPPAPDPFDEYVGAWEGLVNQTVSTRLVVTENGRFRVDAEGTAYRTACDLEGRFRADGDWVWMDVEKTSCSVIGVGSTLERRVIQRTDDSFTVESPDGALVIRYTRRASQ